MLFITPYLIDGKDGGLPEQPQTIVPQRPGMATQKPKIDAATGRLTCTATVLHSGRTMFTADAKLVGEDGKLYAHGSGTFLVYPK